MTLRTRLIALFVLLALTPFVIASVLLRQQSSAALRGLVASTVTDEVYWVARSLEEDAVRIRSEMASFTEEPTLTLRTLTRWAQASGTIEWVRVNRSQTDAPLVVRLEDRDRGEWAWCGEGQPGIPLVVLRNGMRVEVGLAPSRDLQPNPARRLGPSAKLLIELDEDTGSYGWGGSCGSVIGPDPGSAGGQEGGEATLSSTRRLSDGGATISASANPGDFEVPFGQPGLGYWLIVLAASLMAAGAFATSIHRVTRSLEELAEAAEQIGAGNFNPRLPPTGRDEAGRLSLAIRSMAERLRETVDQISRHGRMAVVGELASYLSHEIRNPLSSIQLNLQEIRREVARDFDSHEAVESVDICLREVRRLDRVVSSVLKLGKWRAGEARPVYVHAVLADSLRLVAPQLEHHGVDVRTTYTAEDDLVRGDPEQLTAAFLNLFLNAGDAMSGGGKLRVETSSGERDTIKVVVTDTGRGIPENIRKRIWEPFFTTREEGSGIGLPLAVRTFDEHGGSLALLERQSESEGATFVIHLPLARPGLRRANDQAGEGVTVATASSPVHGDG